MRIWYAHVEGYDLLGGMWGRVNAVRGGELLRRDTLLVRCWNGA